MCSAQEVTQNIEATEEVDVQIKHQSKRRREFGESTASSANSQTSSLEPDPFQALVLVRDSSDATQATVLLAVDEFEVYHNDRGKLKSIVTAAHLGRAARARAAQRLRKEVDQLVLVFDTLPIPEDAQPPEKLKPNVNVDLRSPLTELESTTSLRTESGTAIARQFYMLVTRSGDIKRSSNVTCTPSIVLMDIILLL